MIANVNRGKGQNPFTATDFMPYLEKAETEQDSEAATRAHLAALQARFTGMKGLGSKQED